MTNDSALKYSPIYHFIFYLGNWDARTILAHDLSLNHLEAGLGCSLIISVSSVRNNVNNSSSSRPCDIILLRMKIHIDLLIYYK